MATPIFCERMKLWQSTGRSHVNIILRLVSAKKDGRHAIRNIASTVTNTVHAQR